MFKTTFNPGPSQISDATKADIQMAVNSRLLEISHRSADFSAISADCIKGLRKFLQIPSDYHVFYLDSATQAWHSILCNIVAKNSFHFVNGAFSQKFYQAAQALHKNAVENTVQWGEQNRFKQLEISAQTELITVCANETSSGVSLLESELQYIRKNNENSLLAVDITSCAGAASYNLLLADLWYFSVQKAFGLPAGLGILIVSPRAYEKSLVLATANQNLAGIWQWSVLEKVMREKNYQTPQTPNVLNIYLLAQQCARWNQAGGLTAQVEMTQAKANLLNAWVQDQPDLNFFVTDPLYRSPTVLTVKALPEVITEMKLKAAKAGLLLGSGYGKTKAEVFRIANFPAISIPEIENLIQTLS